MKKILSSVAAIALAAALISCGDSGDTNNTITNSDTIISVGTPVVTGKAYPGVNYITWTPVANASYYEVYRTVNNASELVASNVTGKLEFADFAKADSTSSSDFALVDGVTYQYTIYAVGANGVNVPNRAVYIATSTASTYVKATVPTYGTDITKFDDQTTKDYLAKLAKGEGVTKATLIDPTTFAKTTDYNVTVAYPVIPGYKYGVTLVKDDYVAKNVDVANNQKKATSFKTEFNGTYTANARLLGKGTGKYTAYLTVAALSPLYPTEAVYSLGDVTIADIGEKTPTSNVQATYVEAKKVAVTWTPAKLTSTGKDTDTTNYRVYRAASSDNYQTLTQIDTATNKVFVADKITGTTVVTTNLISGNAASQSTLYAIYDTVTDNAIEYRYYAVHTADGKYGKEASYASIEAYKLNNTAAAPTVSVTTITSDGSNINNTFKIKATPNASNNGGVVAYNKDTISEISWIKLDADVTAGSITKVYDPAGFAKIELKNYDESDGSYTVYLNAKEKGAGTYLFKVTATEPGKNPKVVYVTAVLDGLVDASTITASKTSYVATGATTATKALLVTEAASAKASAPAYTYEIFYVDVNYNPTYSDNVTVTTSSKTVVALSELAATATDDVRSKYLNVTAGTLSGVGTWDNPAAPTATSVTTRNYYVKKTLTADKTVYGIKQAF